MAAIRFQQKWAVEVSLRIEGWSEIKDTITILKIPTTRYSSRPISLSSSGEVETYDWDVRGNILVNRIFKMGDEWQMETPEGMLLDYIECLMESIVRIQLGSGKIMCFPKGKVESFIHESELKEHGRIKHTFENKEDMIEIEDRE